MARRIKAFVERMNIEPNDRVLEIGCGHGVACTLVCELLSSGRYVAIDRSKRMIEAAATRNARFLQDGRAEFLLGDFERMNMGRRKFEKIFAMRVGLFHREPERARGIAERWLSPTGRLFVEYDEP